MSNGSSSAYLLWAILSCIFLAFLILHLWAYDRFNCLRWGAGRQPGTFKRVMTYSYLATVPLLVVFSVAMTTIKFSEGYFLLPSGKIIPKPLMFWKPKNRNWVLPLYFLLSIAWSLELVTHLEELTFWLFLLHQGPGKREWFYSWEFRVWCAGSICAVLGMPLTTLVTRQVLETCQAYIFLVGSSAGTTTTMCFLYVLFHFPNFIRHVKAGGAEPDVVVRLATFYQLNHIRVIFRFLFTIPLLTLAVDALHPPYRIVKSPFALDFLLMVGGIGCFVSSGITLLIFFPRSFTHEAGYKAKMHTPQNSGKLASTTPQYHSEMVPQTSKAALNMDLPPVSPAGAHHHSPNQNQDEATFHSRGESASQFPDSRVSLDSQFSPGYGSDAESEAYTSHTMPTEPRRATGENNAVLSSRGDLRWEQRDMATSADHHPRGPQPSPVRHSVRVTTSLPARPRPMLRSARSSIQLHPYVLHFTSPIDLVDLQIHETRIRYPEA